MHNIDPHATETTTGATGGHCCESSGQSQYQLELAAVLRILGAAVLIILEWSGLLPAGSGTDYIGIAGALLVGYPIWREALESVLSRRMTMTLSMTIAVGAALCLSEVFTALVIIFFVLGAEEIEKFTIFRGRRSMRGLLDLLPKTATIKTGGDLREVSLEAITVGDTVIVRPGERVVVDGTVVAGQSFVEEAAITGESIPSEKVPGARVYAGSINQGGALEVRAESVGQDTVFGKIIQAVQAAENARTAVQKLADRLAAYLVYSSVALAAVTYLLSGDLRQTISVIIVSGACGIAAGTPLAIYGALGRAARTGAIVKGGTFIELLAEVDTVVFDKTGTLTAGEPRLQRVIAGEAVTESELLLAALAAERLSEHPVARALREYAAIMGATAPESTEFHYLPGRGVSCVLDGQTIVAGNRRLLAENGIEVPTDFPEPSGFTEVLVGRAGRFLGGFYVFDRVRDDAPLAVRELRSLGIETIILSGDTTASVKRVADQLGIADAHGLMTPDAKQARVSELLKAGRKVAMVGDGVNDAPALVAATVGVAVGTGTDVAIESADVVLIGSGLVRLVETVKIARRCRSIIWFNFAGTIGIDALGMALAFAGWLSPIVAAFIHVGSELAFLFNSARLLPWWTEDAASHSCTHRDRA